MASMKPTEDLFFQLDKAVFDMECDGVPMQVIIDTLREYLEILEDLDVHS
jgi:hypothetical protein